MRWINASSVSGSFSYSMKVAASTGVVVTFCTDFLKPMAEFGLWLASAFFVLFLISLLGYLFLNSQIATQFDKRFSKQGLWFAPFACSLLLISIFLFSGHLIGKSVLDQNGQKNGWLAANSEFFRGIQQSFGLLNVKTDQILQGQETTHKVLGKIAESSDRQMEMMQSSALNFYDLQTSMQKGDLERIKEHLERDSSPQVLQGPMVGGNLFYEAIKANKSESIIDVYDLLVQNGALEEDKLHSPFVPSQLDGNLVFKYFIKPDMDARNADNSKRRDLESALRTELDFVQNPKLTANEVIDVSNLTAKECKRIDEREAEIYQKKLEEYEKGYAAAIEERRLKERAQYNADLEEYSKMKKEYEDLKNKGVNKTRDDLIRESELHVEVLFSEPLKPMPVSFPENAEAWIKAKPQKNYFACDFLEVKTRIENELLQEKIAKMRSEEDILKDLEKLPRVKEPASGTAKVQYSILQYSILNGNNVLARYLEKKGKSVPNVHLRVVNQAGNTLKEVGLIQAL